MKVAVADMVLVLVASSWELRVSGNEQQLWSHHHIRVDQRSEIRVVAATALIFLLPQQILILADKSIIPLPQRFHIADCSHQNTSTATFLSPTSWALSMQLPSFPFPLSYPPVGNHQHQSLDFRIGITPYSILSSQNSPYTFLDLSLSC